MQDDDMTELEFFLVTLLVVAIVILFLVVGAAVG